MKDSLRIAGLLLSAMLVLVACGSTEGDQTTSSQPDAAEIVRLWIGPTQVDCVGEGPQKCLLVADSENGTPEFLYDEIAGFAHEDGTSYVIDVTVAQIADPPADGSSLSYTLVSIIEETHDDG